MVRTRIFVGNLSCDTGEQQLKDTFLEFGSISNVEIKNKLNIEGDAIAKFAYLNIETDHGESVQNCVYHLNGSILNRSTLKVEVARESFLEKLKREREQKSFPETNQGFHNDNYGNYDNFKNSSYEDKYNFRKRDEDNQAINDKKNSYSFDHANLSNSRHDNFNSEFQNQYEASDRKRHKDQFDPQTYDNFQNKDYGSTVDHKQIILSTFKRYDPSSVNNQNDNFKKANKQQWTDKISRKKNEVKKIVQVSSDLNFVESSSSFSLLDKISMKKDVNDSYDAPMEKSFSTIQMNQVVHSKKPCEEKIRNFFINPSDPDIEESVKWLLTPLTEDNEYEFESIRHDLSSLYKLRSQRAVREFKAMNKKRRFSRGRTKRNKFEK